MNMSANLDELHGIPRWFFPFVIAQSVGANAQQAIGTVVFGGLVMDKILSFLVMPPMCVIVKNLERRFVSRRTTARASLEQFVLVFHFSNNQKQLTA